MNIIFSYHARKRMQQRGITLLEIAHIFEFPTEVRNSHDGTKEAYGEIYNRTIKVVFIQRKNYIKIVSVM